MITGMSIIGTATQLITERKDGIIDRTWVAGVSVCGVVLALLILITYCVSMVTLHYCVTSPDFNITTDIHHN